MFRTLWRGEGNPYNFAVDDVFPYLSCSTMYEHSLNAVLFAQC